MKTKRLKEVEPPPPVVEIKELEKSFEKIDGISVVVRNKKAGTVHDYSVFELNGFAHFSTGSANSYVTFNRHGDCSNRNLKVTAIVYDNTAKRSISYDRLGRAIIINRQLREAAE